MPTATRLFRRISFMAVSRRRERLLQHTDTRTATERKNDQDQLPPTTTSRQDRWLSPHHRSSSPFSSCRRSSPCRRSSTHRASLPVRRSQRLPARRLRHSLARPPEAQELQRRRPPRSDERALEPFELLLEFVGGRVGTAVVGLGDGFVDGLEGLVGDGGDVLREGLVHELDFERCLRGRKEQVSTRPLQRLWTDKRERVKGRT